MSIKDFIEVLKKFKLTYSTDSNNHDLSISLDDEKSKLRGRFDMKVKENQFKSPCIHAKFGEIEKE